MLKHEIVIDGAQGEGGGQILRTALTLSMLTQQPFRIENIRAKRKKAGLLRQHLTCVQAAQQVCHATVQGAVLGSTALHFVPQAIQGGDFNFDIGSAGSCTLVLQTIMLALAHAAQTSVIRLRGGTHNPMAPSASFLQYSYLPLLQKMGMDATLTLERHGFFPAGGGELTLTIQPMQAWKILHLNDRGARLNTCTAESLIAAVPADVAKRELATVKTQMGWTSDKLHIVGLPTQHGPGNVLQLFIRHEAVTEVFTQYGEKGKTAEAVAMRTCQDALAYLASPAAVGKHLTDQLLLPMALAGAGSFSAQSISEHTRTNALIIEKFLPVHIAITHIAHDHHQVTISRI